MVKAAVTGAAGRMGKQIIRVISETEGISLVAATDRPGHESLGSDAGVMAGTAPLGVALSDDFDSAVAVADVVIDFTSAKASMAHLESVQKAGKAIVLGSTGFSSEEKEEIKRQADKARILLAPNMSVGINVLLKVVADVAKMLGDAYDVEIVETHHRFKKDAPSGTALALAEAVAAALDRDLDRDGVHGRSGLVGERLPSEIGIHAVRAGDVVGDHTVLFGGLGERIEITHKASSRETFARGAVRAALWLAARKANGIYGMDDVLTAS